MSLPLAALPQVTSPTNKLDVFCLPRFPTNYATGIRATALALEEVSIVSAKLKEERVTELGEFPSRGTEEN